MRQASTGRQHQGQRSKLSMGKFSPVSERFLEKIDFSGKCWCWTGATQRYGYGAITNGNKLQTATRYAYHLLVGKIPKGLFVLHHCDNPPCVRPSHLFLGTQKDNIDDAKSKGRIPVGENRSSSKLTENEVREIRRRYAAGNVSIYLLGQRFGCTGKNIWLIVTRKTWKSVS